MKKIGIITYFHYTNYGTMLQGYALQQAISNLGREEVSVEMINYRVAEKELVLRQIIFIRIKRILIYFTQLKKIFRLLKYKKELTRRNPLFNSFVAEYLSLSEKCYSYCHELMHDPPLYDIYITGSDQTWSPKIGFNEAMFLEFAPQGKTRAAYAPSIGVASFTKKEEAFLKDRLARYDYLSCREDYGAKLLSDISETKVTTVLDPTLLVIAEEWRKIAEKPQIKGLYILCYFLGDRAYYRYFVKRLSKQLGLPVYYIPVSYMDMSKGNNLLWNVGPREFLGLIDNASIVCTDSFHGMVFCTNFNKTFYCFVKHQGTKAGDNSRIYDFLDRMNLKDRLITKYDGGPIDYKDIDYSDTRERLQKERFVSSQFLTSIINES